MPASRPGTLTVTSTGYAIEGRTATGMATGPGVVAVDPSVIPLGTRTIPGYGTGIAADTGGPFRATIDIWFPTQEQAPAWGRRTVNITCTSLQIEDPRGADPRSLDLKASASRPHMIDDPSPVDLRPAKGRGEAALSETARTEDGGAPHSASYWSTTTISSAPASETCSRSRASTSSPRRVDGYRGAGTCAKRHPTWSMDLNMPGMSGVEATRHISRDAADARGGAHDLDEEQDVMDAILAGACGYLLKDAPIQELMQGLESAAVGGESLISPHIAGKVLQHVRATTAAPEAAATIRASSPTARSRC